MKRKLLACLAISLLVICSTGWADNTTSAQPFATDKTVGKYQEEAQQPTYVSMTADAVLARPALFATTVIGTGLFVITLPFTLLSGSVQQAGEVLVGEPAKATFKRCLGCSIDQDKP